MDRQFNGNCTQNEYTYVSSTFVLHRLAHHKRQQISTLLPILRTIYSIVENLCPENQYRVSTAKIQKT